MRAVKPRHYLQNFHSYTETGPTNTKPQYYCHLPTAKFPEPKKKHENSFK